jgi:small subunit ribosomal protein S21
MPRPINAEVQPRFHNEPFERMIKRFSRKIKKSGILEEVRNRRYYEKPSLKRRKRAAQRKKVLNKLKTLRNKK